jgi:glycosyltransferase involved in cell wall biosynthesis
MESLDKTDIISVVIPYFNDGLYIDEAVDSILNQTYTNVEIIIVNDCSTDPFSIEKITRYNKPKTSVIHHSTNQHLSAARNTGFRAAKGDYVLTLDADDMFAPDFLEKAIAILQTQPAVGAVSAWAKGFGVREFVWQNLKGGSLENFILTNKSVACALIRKSIWEEIGGYDENMKEGYEDWDFWIRMTGAGYRVHVIQEPLFFYRQKPTSMVLQTKTKHYDIYRQIVNKNLSLFQPFLVQILAYYHEQIISLQATIAQLEIQGVAYENNEEKIFRMIYKGSFIIGWANLLQSIIDKWSWQRIRDGIYWSRKRFFN